VARVLFDIVLDQNVSLYIRQRASFDSSSRITAEGRRKILDVLTRRSSDLDFVGKALLLEMIGVADSKRTAQLFLRLLSDKSEYPSVRVQAAKNIIDNFEDGLPIAVENALLEQLSDDSPQVRFACCMALSRSKNIIVTTSLEGLIQDRHIASDDIHSEVRGEVGACAKSAIDEIKARLEKRGSADLYGTSKPG
jgi:HEAT repeat protein